MTSRKIQRQAEVWFLNEAIARGYKPRLTRWEPEPYAMMILGLPIDIRVALPTSRKSKGNQYTRWQWHIPPRKHKKDWILSLIAKDETGKMHVFIMPGAILEGKSHVQITSHPDEYSGRLSVWLNKWELINYFGQEYKNGGPLFGEVEVSNE